MAEYIEKDKLIKAFYDEMQSMKNTDRSESADKVFGILMRYVNSFEAADVQPVKHGYWEEVNDYSGWGDTHYRCSVCGEEWYLEDGKPKDNNMNFCPRCGTKMDAEPDEPWQSD